MSHRVIPEKQARGEECAPSHRGKEEADAEPKNTRQRDTVWETRAGR